MPVWLLQHCAATCWTPWKRLLVYVVVGLSWAIFTVCALHGYFRPHRMQTEWRNQCVRLSVCPAHRWTVQTAKRLNRSRCRWHGRGHREPCITWNARYWRRLANTAYLCGDSVAACREHYCIHLFELTDECVRHWVIVVVVVVVVVTKWTVISAARSDFKFNVADMSAGYNAGARPLSRGDDRTAAAAARARHWGHQSWCTQQRRCRRRRRQWRRLCYSTVRQTPQWRSVLLTYRLG